MVLIQFLQRQLGSICNTVCNKIGRMAGWVSHQPAAAVVVGASVARLQNVLYVGRSAAVLPMYRFNFNRVHVHKMLCKRNCSTFDKAATAAERLFVPRVLSNSIILIGCILKASKNSKECFVSKAMTTER